MHSSKDWFENLILKYEEIKHKVLGSPKRQESKSPESPQKSFRNIVSVTVKKKQKNEMAKKKLFMRDRRGSADKVICRRGQKLLEVRKRKFI
jgi:hypothetical protein